MPEKNKVLVPTRSYDLKLMIEDLDYTNDLDRVRIISTVNAPYQVIILELLLDQNDIMAKKLFGREPLKLTIRYQGRVSQRGSVEQTEFELIQLNDKSGARVKSTLSTEKSKEPSRVTLYTVPREPLKTMTTSVNDVFLGKTPSEIIEELVGQTDADLDIDGDGLNEDAVDQIIIPPCTLYKAIRYLDDNFGIFDGASNLGFCKYDNTVSIMNLTKRMTKNQTFTVYHMSNDTKDTGDIVSKCDSGDSFYTFSPLSTTYTGNQILANIAKNMTYNVKPSNELYREITKNFDDVCEQYGITSKSGLEFYSDSILDDREIYKITAMGNDKSETFINSRLGRLVVSLATVKLQLQRNLQIMNLMNVGEPVKLITKTMEYVELSGKYILKSSDLLFTRETKDWMSFATIVLCRTNKTN